MKYTQRQFARWATLFVGLVPMLGQGATFNANGVAGLRNAINQARNNGPGKDVINFTTNGAWQADGGTIVINTPVDINGGNRNQARVFNGDNNGVIFAIRSNNITIRNITIGGNNDGTGIQLGGYWNTVIMANTIQKNNLGIVSFGAVPKNLTVTGNSFVDNKVALWTLRDCGRSQGSNPLWGGKYVINNNWVRGFSGFILDNGNDGTAWVNGKPVHAATGYLGSPQSPNVTSYADGSEVSNNTFVQISQFGVGLARCNNVDIKNNTIRMKNDNGFGGCIQLEHKTVNSLVTGNKCHTVGRKGGVNLVSFSDHGATPIFQAGVRNIWMTDNQFFGSGIAFFSEGFGDVKAFRNNFSQSKVMAVRHVAGGKNWFAQNWGNTGLPNGRLPVRTYGPQ